MQHALARGQFTPRRARKLLGRRAQLGSREPIRAALYRGAAREISRLREHLTSDDEPPEAARGVVWQESTQNNMAFREREEAGSSPTSPIDADGWFSDNEPS